MEEKLNYDDIVVIPEEITDITSRKECNPYDDENFLPIFASCMTSVVSIDNTKDFNDAKIRVVIPRSYSIEDRLEYMKSAKGFYNFIAFSLNEAKEIFLDESYLSIQYNEMHRVHYNICIDLANGHMRYLLDVVKGIKEKWGEDVIIMTGNIANPKTYKDYCEAGVDYVRCNIGTGGCCSTSSNTSIHFAPFSLLKEIYEIKKEINGHCKIIADGGIKGYRDIQKALIYADYVMIGGLFNKAIESAGKTTYGKSYWNIRGYKIMKPLTTLFTYGKEIKRKDFDKAFDLIKANKLTVWKEVYGMSTKKAQLAINLANGKSNSKLKTAEGLVKYQKAEFNIAGWAENETDYLRSAMSYTNSRTLNDYKESQWVRITNIKYNN